MSTSDIIENDNSAIISDCGKYRYMLTRWWSADMEGKAAVFIMLNPSTADASNDDPTIRRCIGFAKTWGCASLSVVNLFGLRATNPAELLNAGDPVGPMNDSYISKAVAGDTIVVCAWGAHRMAQARADYVLSLLRANSVSPMCLKLTKGGDPAHPLYLPKDLKPIPFKAGKP